MKPAPPSVEKPLARFRDEGQTEEASCDTSHLWVERRALSPRPPRCQRLTTAVHLAVTGTQFYASRQTTY